MIILKELTLNNFLSHRDTRLEISPNGKLLIDGRSGAGKSSLIDALVWVLYGRGRVDSRSLIHKGEKSAKVILIISDGTLDYRIERSINSQGKHDLKISEKDGSAKNHRGEEIFIPIKVSGLKNLQDHLEKQILRSSYLLFVNSVAHLQENVESFVKQTASKRKDILLEIIGSEDYDKYYEKTRKMIDSEERSNSELEGSMNILASSIRESEEKTKNIPSIKKTIDRIEKEIESIAKESEQLEASKSESVKIRTLIDSIDKNIINIEKDIFVKNNAIMEAKKRVNELNDSTATQGEIEKDLMEQSVVQKSLDEMDKLRMSAAEWDRKMLDLSGLRPIDLNYEKVISELNSQIIKIMSEKINKCPELDKECPIVGSEKQKRIDELSSRLNTSRVSYEAYKIALKEYYDKVSELGDRPDTYNLNEKYQLENQKMAGLRDNIERIRGIMAKREQDLAVIISSISMMQGEVDNMKADILAKTLERNEHKKRLDSLSSMIAEMDKIKFKADLLKHELDQAKIELAVANNAMNLMKDNIKTLETMKASTEKKRAFIESLKLLKDAFSPTGIKAMVIDYIIPKLEDKINDILSRLSEFRVRLDTQKNGVTGTVIEGLFISIFNELGEEMDFDNYSGGEKLKITVAISEALAEVQNIGFRILDEAFMALDSESIEKFAEVILALQNRFNQMVCISHLRDIKDMFNERIEIIKVNGISKLIN